MAELKKIPTEQEIELLLGTRKHSIWKNICATIDSMYDMDRQWNQGGKLWEYEYKYRRGGKTLCALYINQDRMGIMIIFGKVEREKFDAIRNSLSPQTLEIFDLAKTYHDGKWVMFDETLPISDMKLLLDIKRRANKK